MQKKMAAPDPARRPWLPRSGSPSPRFSSIGLPAGDARTGNHADAKAQWLLLDYLMTHPGELLSCEVPLMWFWG